MWLAWGDHPAHNQPMHDEQTTGTSAAILDRIERLGNALPDPVTLFIGGALLVMVLSQVADWAGWTVEKTVSRTVVVEGVEQVELASETVEPIGLLTRDGLFWAIHSMVDNFMDFPPLGVVLVGMLGIGIAEKSGLIGALLKAFMQITPRSMLTPSLVFIGIMSSMALDAGYIVLPPIACALYKAVGRSPLVGLAAVFSGIGAGFSANLLVTGLDPLLAGFTTIGARVLDADYEVAPTCNWWFMIASTFALTLLGWAVTHYLVEPRYERKPAEDGGPDPDAAVDLAHTRLSPEERRGLGSAAVSVVLCLAALALMVVPAWGPLHGTGERFSRWVEAIVPLIFIGFLIPGLVYGVVTHEIRSDKDMARLMAQTMIDMAPYIVMAFFAAQFIAYFNHSRLGEMLAIVGGQTLAASGLPKALLLAAFILLVGAGNLFIGSASAKYAFLAPVFVPMFMAPGVNISPELTQAAYRVGDSATNIIAPLNPYIIVLIVFMQKYVPRAGIGTLVSLMLPYSIVFIVVWTILLIGWVMLGLPLGPEGPLTYGG